ncbi:hypothetical protein [Pseudomonas frederiksbergensis]|jgi:hypothetical protein|uniref:Lipoprotein n=1 Tax=Pseudomonas frederiksbergensis TaxID=104087 RepID=A0A0B1YR94_9PSED|nr:hypothetical protein [Pseudomonas frederiksbergensis]KHK61194.1 hypothetical protein JZ00_29930 [Pseudomonas frederiksbergensis]WRV70765.1 hypothetical protein VQ575_12245 [Pseudomonas frederiksbergensis]
MIKKIPIVIVAMLISLSGCAKDYGLAPPADSEKVTVTVKLPKELTNEVMQVVYRSTICTFTDHTAMGKPYQRDEYQRTDIWPVRQGQSDLYRAELPMDGGGACQWHLSNVTFGVVYADPTRFGESVVVGGGGGIVVIFDHNNSPRGGADFKIDGDLMIKKDYYPWLKENFLDGYVKRISLAGEASLYLKYQALQARQVFFEPILHSNYLVTSEGTKVHKVGSFIKFTYPDGTVVADGSHNPDLRKLQAIRLAAENKK